MATRGTTEDRQRPSRRRRPAPPPLPERDVRRKRPPALSFLLRMDTLRRVARARVAAGARPRRDLPGDRHRAGAQGGRARRLGPVGRLPPGQGLRVLRLPGHRAAVRQGRALRRPRRAPGPVEHRRLALPGHGGGGALRDRQRPPLLQLLHLLRLALLRGRLRVDVPLRLRAHDRAAAARGGLPAPRGARGHRRAHRGRGARAALAAAATTSTSSASSRWRRGPTTG